MKFLLVLSVLVSVCCAADLLGVDKCTRGPSYWCSHIRAAKECGAVKHCKDNVWSMKYQKENDEVCDFCKEVIVTVRNLIANNATEQQITGFLKSACDLITDAELKLMCNTAVTEYAQELFDLIISELDPEVVCTAMGLCQPAMSNKMPDMKPILKKVPNADLCTECKTVITEAKQALADNKTREEILEVLEQLCQQLGPFEAECDDFMKQYIPQLLDLLEAQLDPEVICQALGFCSSVMKKKLILPSIELTPAKKMKNVDASVQCIVCEFAMQEIDKLITQNSSASEIISVVDKVCEILPSTIRGECKSFVDEYGPAIIQLLVQEVSPDKICSMLKLCMAVTLKADTECNLCKLVIQYADSVLIKNLTQQEIIKGLHDFCNVLPDNLKSQLLGLCGTTQTKQMNMISYWLQVLVKILEKL
uniref:Prosaposin-like n=1 Tax=Saccoglossus kowalevskii TaxID=10224 RepID=A0ABM0LUZ2_SACKO|nr:PREDICTED: prosaposin-like [Saccoglossus kowalevskii]